jgi:4-hydroxy-tetrahydrodipicolinate synthase
MEFGSLITAMVTPFDSSGELDLDEAIKLGHHLIETGSTALLLTGTTGESPTLTHNEEYRLFEAMVQEFRGKVHIMAGTGSNCTRTAIESSQIAEKLKVDSLLHVSPYYNKPSQDGMYAHFTAIADSVDTPIMLYNIPGRSVVNLEPETVQALSAHSNIVAIKEAANSVEQVRRIRELTPSDFLIYSGDDSNILNFMVEGACGVVSVASHIVGKQIEEMIVSFNNNDLEKARQLNAHLMPLFDGLFVAPNPTPVKAALNMLGFNVGGVRLPLMELSSEDTQFVQRLLSDMDLI